MAGRKAIETEMELKAIDFRIQNGYSSSEPVYLKSLLLKRNILSFFCALSDDFSGMALKIGENRFMMVNSNQRLGKQHFTIAHELYHLFIQENFTSQRCRTGQFDRRDIEEFKADVFAAYFLMPTEGIQRMIPNDEIRKGVSLQTVLKIEQFFSVSRTALLYRLKSMGFIDSATYEKYSADVIKSAVFYGFPTTLYEIPGVQPVIGDYGVLAQQLFSSGEISESHYYELMEVIGINPLNISEDVGNGF